MLHLKGNFLLEYRTGKFFLVNSTGRYQYRPAEVGKTCWPTANGEIRQEGEMIYITGTLPSHIWVDRDEETDRRVLVLADPVEIKTRTVRHGFLWQKTREERYVDWGVVRIKKRDPYSMQIPVSSFIRIDMMDDRDDLDDEED